MNVTISILCIYMQHRFKRIIHGIIVHFLYIGIWHVITSIILVTFHVPMILCICQQTQHAYGVQHIYMTHLLTPV